MKTEDIIKYALIAVGAYLVWEYVLSPMMAGTAAAPTPTPGTGTTTSTSTAGTVPNSTITSAPSVSIANNSGGSNAAFRVGDTFTVTVTGAPNTTVTMAAVYNGQSQGTTTLGTTNAQGVFSLSNTMPSSNVGTWQENWFVGPTLVGNLTFTVSGGSSNQTSSPADLGSLLTTAAGSAAQFGLNIDQWAYYYAGLPGRSAIPVGTLSTMMANAGITDANRSTQIMDVGSFVGALNSVGLTGLGAIIYTPNNMGMGTLRGGFSGKRPNAFSGAGRKTSYVQ